MMDFEPQRDFLSLLTLGDGTAIGTKFGLSFTGATQQRFNCFKLTSPSCAGSWVWWLKDRIDRGWMQKFSP